MDYVDGEDLSKYIINHTLTTDQAVSIFKSIVMGVNAIHEQRIVHRDLKPANIYITLDGKVKILDFDFSNHGKIIMTDKVVYIGSENYSEESEQNTEFGFISRAINFIDYLKNEVFSEVKQNSVPYYEHDFGGTFYTCTCCTRKIRSYF